MVENLVSTYKCPYCGGSNISESHIDIVGAAGNTVNIDMHCPSCKKHFMAKTEVMQMELGNISPEKLAKLEQSIQAIKGKLGGNINIDAQMMHLPESALGMSEQEASILDEEIVDLGRKLKHGNMSVSDLFSDDE